MICKNCNTENLDGATFCKTCGSRIDGKKVCPVCDFANKETDSFCSKCGARIDGKKFCANCGCEVEGLFCTTCGQKYDNPAPKTKKSVNSKNKADNVISKIFDLAGNSVLLLGTIFSLLFVFFIDYSSKFVEGNNIYYYFGEAYKNLKDTYTGVGAYSASLELSAYIPVIISTIVISLCLIGCLIFSIITIVNFVKKYCFGGEKCPSLYPLLAIALYLVCAISFRNITYTSVTGLNNLIDIDVLQLNGATKAGITLTTICALLYYVSTLINNAINLQKNQIAKFAISITTTVFLIVVFILLCNSFATATITYKENSINYNGCLTLSFPVASAFLTAMSYETEMIGAVIISGFIQILSVSCMFITLFAIINSMDVENNNLPSTIIISLFLLFILVLSSITLNLFTEFLYEINPISSSEKYLTLGCSMAVVSFIVSLIPIATAIVNFVLDKKAE